MAADGPKISFSMLPASSGGGGSSDRPKKPSVQIRVGGTGKHPSVSHELEQEAQRIQTEYAHHRRRRTSSSEHEAERLRRAWEEVEAKRRELAEQWPDELTPPHAIPTIHAIDWDTQPPVPAEKIDWSRQGEPLRVRFTLGAIITSMGLAISILGAGAYFYWGVRAHISDATKHLPSDGVPWGVKAHYEMRGESVQARKELVTAIDNKLDQRHIKLKADLIKALKPRRRRR